ncbi:MAG: PilZ domain-containing protein [Spirochaetes bacterium]|nr:PilZ domain-containing protein [Spirochaetota bacterium]MBX3722679.1 PilZ domain-containing protein [Turneriella sp.]
MENPSEKPAHEVRKIIDHAQLHQITERLFCRLPLHLIHNNQRHSVQAMNYQHPQFEVLHQLPRADARTLLLEKDDHSMMLECSVVGRTEKGTEVLKPMRLYLTKRGVRHENRMALGDAGSFAGVVIHCLPHGEFYKTNAATNAARDQAIQQYTAAFKGLIPDATVKVELIRHNRLSVRVKKMQDFNLPVFAPVMERERQGDDLSVRAIPYSEYTQIMRSDGLPGDFMGEICEPIMYRGAFMVGYVQVLTLGPAALSQYHQVRQLTRRLETDLEARGAFPKNPITGKIVDLSFGGIGFNYTTQRNIMSGVSTGDKIVFDARFNPENFATLSGRVMNVSAQENAMRFGVEMENVSEAARTAIDNMLNSQS